MYVVGLTGGIGSGKSTVSELFVEIGVPLLDTDQVARDVVAPGASVLTDIKDYFGPEALNPDGSLNRPYLRNQIFTDETARQQLETLLHPLILRRCREWLEQQKSSYAILVIPLLFEKGWAKYCDRILVIDIDDTTQCQRVMLRDQISEKAARQIIASQISRQARLAGADDVIINNDAVTDLPAQVSALHQQYLKLAQEKNS